MQLNRISCWFFTISIGLLGFSRLNSQTIRIMPLGDSITEGVHGSDPTGGYRDDLYFLLQAAGIDFNFVGTKRDGDPNIFDVDHQGFSGIRADEILDNLNRWLNLRPPDIILLHIGTNDISQGQTAESTLSDIDGILERIYAFDPNIKTLLASLVPRKDSKNSITNNLNGMIQSLVGSKQQSGYKVYYTGINEAFKANSNWRYEYFDDTVHPNNLGYHVMAQEWYSELQTVLFGNLLTGVPDKMVIVSGNHQAGTRGTILPQPLVVKVMDVYQNPVENIEVQFQVKSGNGAIQPESNGQTQFIEAESVSTIHAPSRIIYDSEASNGAYVASDELKKGSFTVSFSISDETEYWIWGRVYGVSPIEDSFFLMIDDDPDTILWDLKSDYNQWYWMKVKDRDAGTISLSLSAGEHQLHFITREMNSRLDKIVVTSDRYFTPHDKQGFPNPTTNENGEVGVFWLLGSEIGTQQVEASCSLLDGEALPFSASSLVNPADQIAITGEATYYSHLSPIQNIQIFLNDSIQTVTDTNGEFDFQQLAKGQDFVVKPESFVPAQNASSTILSYDASLAARYALGLENFSDPQKLAADADADGQILLYDASLIARFSVGLDPLPDSYVGQWRFMPDSIFYSELDTLVSSVQFTGVVCGDVHGGWSPVTPAQKIISNNLLQEFHYWQNDTLVFNIPIKFGKPVYSFDLKMSFDPSQYEIVQIDISNLESIFHININKKPDEIRLGGYTINGSSDDHHIGLKFRVDKNNCDTPITLEDFRLNDTQPIKSEFYPDIDNNVSLPSQFVLYQNYPNPFYQTTTIRFYMPQAGKIQLRLFNILGQEVWSLKRTFHHGGYQALPYDGKDRFGNSLVSGHYILSIQGYDGISQTKKMNIIK